MKLTINRTMKRNGHLLALLRARSPSMFMQTFKEQGVFRKAAVYYLNVDLDVTREEMKLLKKKGAWELQQQAAEFTPERPREIEL